MSGLPAITQQITSERALERVCRARGHTKITPKAIEEAKLYAGSVLAEIKKTQVDPKKDLTRCNPQSIEQCLVDACSFGLMIDGKQHAHLVKYGNNVTLQIGYRGYLAKISEHFEDANIDAFPVYAGDKIEISGSDGFDSYDYKKGNPFPADSDFQGIVSVLTYTRAGRKFQKVLTMSKAEIDKIKGCAKQTFIWDKWYIEKAKVAAIKRLCKMQFSTINSLQELIKYDNEQNFSFGAPSVSKGAKSILDNLNSEIDESLPKKDAEFIDSDVIDQTTDQDDQGDHTPPESEIIDVEYVDQGDEIDVI